ncbi:MAG: TonB-dependent receptor [Phenylobacterium sp.]|uniref:TonB-dependent receptor n=1 Tax=Phenylobacterium sp. TaxID=1871053 RepID=UPI002622D72C|nr:TonB-dependent receptor [Phenylobacterium sp.]MDB5499054.1 TonB-dependent receptor [Phenylobacterium sp.]
MTHALKAALFASIAATALAATPALAQTPTTLAAASTADAARLAADEGASVNEVVVTARRQEERAIDVPIALSALSGETLEKTGAYTLADIQNQVPSMVAFNSNPRNSSVGIRGIGVSSASDGLDTSVGFYVDGVYLGRPGMALTDLIDVQSVEVLRGPQGTLFGRNTSAGVLNITTRKPSFQPGADLEVSGGSYNYNQVRASVTGPLIDGVLAGRLTAFETHRDGVLDNIKTGIKANSIGRQGIRAQLLYTPSSKLTVRVIGDYSSEDDTCCVSVLKTVLPRSISVATARTLSAFQALGYAPAASLNYTLNNAPQNMRTDQKGASVEVSYDLGWADATSITAWKYWHFNPLQDSDGTPLDIIQVNVAQTRDTQWSQEFRLASKPGRLDWQAGVYLFDQRLKDHYILNQFGSDASAFYTTLARLANPAAAAITIAPSSQYIDDTSTKTDSAAAFGQVNFHVTEQLTATGGLRYTYDKREGISDTSTIGTPYAATSIPFHYNVTVEGGNWSYLASLSYKLTDHSLAYASYSTGYKSAGLNLNSAVSAGSPLVLQPEKVGNWEVGLKQSLLDNRATLNLSGFWTDLTGLQANIVPSNGARSYLANVGDVRAKGVEAEATWEIVRGLDASLNGSYNDVRYTSYPNAPCGVGVTGTCNLTGQPVFQAPKWVWNASLRYAWDLGGDVHPYAQAQYSYRSGVFGTVDDSPYGWIPAYSLVNARLGAKFGDGRYDASIWVNNLADTQYFQNLSTASIVGAAAYGFAGQLGPPRTWGATLRAQF